jgi:hypothetical protein
VTGRGWRVVAALARSSDARGHGAGVGLGDVVRSGLVVAVSAYDALLTMR